MILGAVTSKLLGTTDSSEWERVGSFELKFETDHPQGLMRIGERYFLSSVRFPRTAEGKPDPSAPGKGFLIEIERGGGFATEKKRLELCDGLAYHPGGLASDEKVIYVPVSEYRPDSSALIYKVDVETFQVIGDPVRFPDHLGALSLAPDRKRIFGMSWAARKIYIWDTDRPPAGFQRLHSQAQLSGLLPRLRRGRRRRVPRRSLSLVGGPHHRSRGQ